jgi:enoyl-CoA hydratase/carnithine racemase
MEVVRLEVDGSVALVSLDRPPVNALSETMALELQDAFRSCQSPEVRAVVVTGKPHFAAGGDIKGFKETYDRGEVERTGWNLQIAVALLESLQKPTIAAVHGFALGGGLELALGCDFRYLANDARVGQPEILLGLIPGAGGTQRLPRVVGYQRAKEMIYSGRQVDAVEALTIGLADKTAPTEDLLELALADAAVWATKATRAIAGAKRALDLGAGLPVEQGVLVEKDEFQAVFATTDGQEGVTAFVEKRPPEFEGR